MEHVYFCQFGFNWGKGPTDLDALDNALKASGYDLDSSQVTLYEFKADMSYDELYDAVQASDMFGVRYPKYVAVQKWDFDTRTIQPKLDALKAAYERFSDVLYDTLFTITDDMAA